MKKVEVGICSVNLLHDFLNILKENDFEPHGYKTTSNLGGNEIQISNSGDAARIRDSHTGNIYW